MSMPATERKPYRLHGEYTAGAHAFGPEMTCERCGITWARHQLAGEQCPRANAARSPVALRQQHRARCLPPVTRIGQRIRARRNEFHISQETLARIAGHGLRQGDISSYETGIKEPSHLHLAALAEALRVTAAWLLGHQDPIHSGKPQVSRAT